MEVKYFRNKNVITDKNGNVIFTGTCEGGKYPSINAAKRESRKLQAAEGSCLRVVK